MLQNEFIPNRKLLWIALPVCCWLLATMRSLLQLVWKRECARINNGDYDNSLAFLSFHTLGKGTTIGICSHSCQLVQISRGCIRVAKFAQMWRKTKSLFAKSNKSMCCECPLHVKARKDTNLTTERKRFSVPGFICINFYGKPHYLVFRIFFQEFLFSFFFFLLLLDSRLRWFFQSS